MLIAHRGESYLAPENTLAAFNLAWDKGASDAVELDIRLTQDGTIVACHDADTKRLSKDNLVVNENSYQQLSKIDMGSHKDSKYAGEPIPTLEQALATTPKNGRWFIEIKSGVETVAPFAKVLEKSGLEPKQTDVIAFDKNVIAQTRKQIPQIKAFWLTGPEKDETAGKETIDINHIIDTSKQIGAHGVDLRKGEYLTKEFISALHSADLKVYVWTVDDPAEAKKLLDSGIDGVTTNRPAWIEEQLRIGS